MAGKANALYSPYGAFELKSKYQRNFFFGTLSTWLTVGLILGTFWVIRALGGGTDADITQVLRIKSIADLGPPPSIAKKPPQVKVEQPNVVAPKVGIPKPVADDEVLDDDVVLATRDELAEIVAPDIVSSAGDGDIIVDIDEDDYLPAFGEFVPVEIYPEMIFNHRPIYPKIAKQAGLTGKVTVMALVDKKGDVKDAKVLKSSGIPSLDDAAVKAARKNKFKPGIQNGRPIACWVSYDVDFTLNE